MSKTKRKGNYHGDGDGDGDGDGYGMDLEKHDGLVRSTSVQRSRRSSSDRERENNYTFCPITKSDLLGV